MNPGHHQPRSLEVGAVLAWPQKIRGRRRWTPRAGARAQPMPWPVAAVAVVSAERTGVASPAVVSAVSSARPFSSSWPAGRGRRRVAQLPPANTRASKQFNLELIRINDYKRPNDHGDGRSVWSGAYQISTRGSRAEQTVRREPKGPAGPYPRGTWSNTLSWTWKEMPHRTMLAKRR